MARTAMGLLAVLGLLPALRAEDTPKKGPATAAGQYKALADAYQKALAESDRVFNTAKTEEEKQNIRAAFAQVRSKLIDRFLAFADKHPKDNEALLALFFVLHLDTEAERGQVDKAVQLVLKDHIKSDRLTDPPILQFVVFLDFPATEKLLRGVLEKNPHQAMQAQACLSLAQITRKKADARPPKEAARLNKEAEELFERVVTKYADIKAVAEKAKAELFEIRHLAIGKALPDIKGKDSDGREFKLSDYRGKVVVLNFWADWCPPCMKMVPHERSLVKRLEGKPFVLIGVNRNASRESLKKCEAKHEMTWRSFFDGLDGPISKGHNIKSMPTVYVLDARGVIRYKGVRGEAMDKAVDVLLKEAESEKR